MHKWEESIKVGLTLKRRQKWYSEEFATAALFPGLKPRCWCSLGSAATRSSLSPDSSSLFCCTIFPFFLIIFAGRRFKRCRTITNSHDLLLHFFYFLIHKILKHGPEGKSQLPFKCEYLWIFGRNIFKSGLFAWLPFTTGTCLQKYVDKIHILPNCESDQQCPWARVVKRTNLIYFNLIWF